jgi:hypothetical protein
VTRTVAFVLHQPQDYVVSAGYARLLRQRAARRGEAPPTVVALVLGDEVDASVARHAEELGPVYVLGNVRFPPLQARAIAWTVLGVRALRRRARALPLAGEDVVVAYSFREFVTNVLLRALPERPTLVRIRKCDHASEATLTRRRRLVSLYYNAWNMLFGANRLRYRWLPTTNRSWAGTFVSDPYDLEFCVGPPGSPAAGGRWIPYPFPALLDRPPATQNRPAIVFLGELYPFHESLEPEAVVRRLNEILGHVRDRFDGYRLVFKPRASIAGLGLDLGGYDVAYAETPLEELLLREPAIEKVLSVKSSGSALASLYGKEAYLLYRLFDFPADFRANLDGYFAPYAGSACFVERLDEIGSAPRLSSDLDRLETDAAPLLDVLTAGPD